MKRLIILFQIVFVAISYPLYGQQIPNPSFETWSNRGQWGNLPRDWYGTNYTDFVNHVGVTRIADNAVDGQFHVKMEAKSVNFFGATYKIPGGLTLSDLYHATGVDFFKEGKPKAGVAFGGTPSRVTGFYKYKSVNNSELYMSAVLTKWRGTYRDTIALGEKFSTLTVTEWTPFELKLDYNSTENPDTMNIVFLTSAVFNQNDLPKVQPGSTMEIDHLGLVMADYFEVDYTTEGNPCTGNTLTFKASSENTPASRWEWYIGPTYAGNQQTLSYQFPEVTEPTNFNVRLRGVSPVGTDEVTKIITIHPNPDIRLLPENPEICPGSTITISATGGESYIWNVTGAVNNQITVTPTIGTVYEIIGKDQYGCTNFASSRIFYHRPDTTNLQASFCSNSFYDFFGNSLTLPGIYFHTLKSVVTGCDSTIRLTLNELPTSELSIISDRNNICPSQTVKLTATEGFESYDWGNGTSTNNTLQVNPEVTTTYHVTAKMANGCNVTDSLTIEIIPPIVNVQQKDICFGDSILIFGDWQFTSGTFDELFQNINGCDSIERIILNVLPLPEPDLQADKQAICAGDTVTLTAKSGYSNYIWTPENPNQNMIKTVLSESTEIKVTVISNKGCRSTDSLNILVIASEITDIQTEICPGDSIRIGGVWVKEPGIYSDTLRNESGCNGIIRTTLILKQIPALEIFGNFTAACEGEMITLNATPGWNSYQWNNGNISVPEYSTRVKESGFISLKVTAANGCMKFDSIYIEGNKKDTLVLSYSICNNDSIQIFDNWVKTPGEFRNVFENQAGCDSLVIITVSVNSRPVVFHLSGSGTYGESEPGRTILLDGSEPGNSYKLYKNGTEDLILQGTGSSLDFGVYTEGIYWVIAENQNICTSLMTDSVFINLLVSSKLPYEKDKPYLYPNPTKNKVYISSPFNGSIRITDIQGRQVQLFTDFEGTSIDISGLRPGLYFILLADGLVTYSNKITIVH